MMSDTSALNLSSAEASQLVDKLIHKLLHNEDSDGKFLLPLNDGRIIDTKGWNGWEWTHGVALFALFDHYQLTSAASSLDIIHRWFADRRAEGGTTKNINTMAALLSLACVYELDPTSHPEYKDWLVEWAEWVMTGLPKTEEGGFQHITYELENKGQLWDDTLMMTVLPLAKIGKVLGVERYVEEAKYQFLLHIKYLYDPKTGLWFHGWTFEGRHHFAGAHWARGNCWITLAIPLFFHILGKQDKDLSEHESYFSRYLIDTLEAQLDALLPLQDKATGLWHTLLKYSDSYVESSATAGFAAGAYLALKFGLVKNESKKQEYQRMADAALKGVVDMIADDGELQQTSFGTAMGHDLDFYRKIPITPMPYGQALALLAIVQNMALHTPTKA
ncbi:related to unsaturated glucuronyl hydrolase involved in regulation of bacterial surface properties, and related proteins [Ustilago trichophora]|uniref:Related to unsaturated glucuronyl hydrolase involved in regulation of bacterial surface properties, and related proteins n=1 Tax=Ustilago trichophora TaxID=86804 RepID=A0A5C3DXT5_9BASI|nr:related to unsaturated glucuronyl hydrolase involved in regulation of bacterial surface properties, and related proteins [Ustilago trichophora]